MNDGIINWNVDPEIFWITESFPLKYYGLLFAIGILIAFQIEKRIYITENIPVERLTNCLSMSLLELFWVQGLGIAFSTNRNIILKSIEILLPIKK